MSLLFVIMLRGLLLHRRPTMVVLLPRQQLTPAPRSTGLLPATSQLSAPATVVLTLTAHMSGRHSQPLHERSQSRRPSNKAIKREKRKLSPQRERPVRDVYETLPHQKFAGEPLKLDQSLAFEEADRVYYDMLMRGSAPQLDAAQFSTDGDAPTTTAHVMLPPPDGDMSTAVVPQTRESLTTFLASAKTDDFRTRRRAVAIAQRYLTEKAKTDEPAELERVVEMVKRTLGYNDISLYCHVAHAHSLRGDTSSIKKLMKRARADAIRPNEVLWTILMKTYFQKGDIKSAFRCLFHITMEDKLLPDTPMFTTALVNASKLGSNDLVWDIYHQMRHGNMRPDTITYTFMMHVAGRELRSEKALALYDEMKQFKMAPSLVTFNTLMLTCSDQRHFVPKVFELAGEMEACGLKANIETIEILLKACSLRGDLTRATQLWDEYLSLDQDDKPRRMHPTMKCYLYLLAACANATTKSYSKTYDEEMARTNEEYARFIAKRVQRKINPGTPVQDEAEDDSDSEDEQSVANGDASLHASLERQDLRRERKRQANRELQDKKREFLQNQARKAVEVIHQTLAEIHRQSQRPESTIELNRTILYMVLSGYCNHNQVVRAKQVLTELYPACKVTPNAHDLALIMHMAGRLRKFDLFQEALSQRLLSVNTEPLTNEDYEKIVYALTRCDRVDQALKWLLRMHHAFKDATIGDYEFQKELFERSIKEGAVGYFPRLGPNPKHFKALWLKIAQLRDPRHMAVWHKVFDTDYTPPDDSEDDVELKHDVDKMDTTHETQTHGATKALASH